MRSNAFTPSFSTGTVVVPVADPRHLARVEWSDGNNTKVRFIASGWYAFFKKAELRQQKELPPWLQHD